MQNLPFSAPSISALAQGYDAWASAYDRDVRNLGYTTPEHVADAVCRHLDRRNLRLLDVGAGTGLMGEKLYRRGYRHLIGMDASQGMLAQAARKGIYGLLSRMVLGRPLGYASRAFDGLMASGVFSSGQAPPESLLELRRVVRPGGWIIFSLKWDGVFESAFLPTIQQLEERGRWQRQAWSHVYPSWPRTAPALQARVLVYRVL
jgi:predicted TPR repeat methyltransferase